MSTRRSDASVTSEEQVGMDWRWPLWGVAAGVLGAVGHLFSMQVPSDEEYRSGAAVVDALERGPYHVGIVSGLAGVFCLLVFAAGWRRWTTAVAPNSLAAGALHLALTASAGAMMLAYGFKGALAIYLPDGMDEGTYANESLLTFFMFDDFSAFISWWGVAMACGAIAWLALRERRLPLWIGLVAALFAIVPVGLVTATGLPGFPGVIDPFGLVIISAGLAFVFWRQGSGHTVAAPAKAALAS
jgi:hypothetical protein